MRDTVLVRKATFFLAAAVAALVWASPSLALTPAQADAIAVKAFTALAAKGNVALLGLPAPVPAGTSVFDGGTATATPTASVAVAPVATRSWVYWDDLAYGAKFQHPGKLVLIDDASGKVTSTTPLQWWPLVNGKRQTWRVVVAAGGPAGRTVSAAARPALPARGLGAIPAGALKDDCLVMIGKGSDPKAAQDFVGMQAAAAALGLRSFDVVTATANVDPNGADLARAVKQAVGPPVNCKDVFIYISGHGYKTGPTGVNTGSRWTKAGKKDRKGRDLWNVAQAIVTADDIGAIVKDNAAKATFKLVVDACFSGRFVLDLPKDEFPGLLVIAAASKADEVSWFYLSSVHYSNGTDKPSTTDNPGNKDAKKGRSEFTNGLIAGLTAFAGSATEVGAAQKAGGSLLARMIDRAVQLGRAQDFAATTRLTTPVGSLNAGGPVVEPPKTQVTATLTLSHHHIGGGISVICGKVTTVGGATVEIKVRGNGGFTAQSTVTADGAGNATFSFLINQYDTYTAGATVTRSGATATAAAEHVVGPADATCP